MTRQETGVIMDILTTAYPRFYSGKDAPDMRQTVNLWASMFADEPVTLVAAAVKVLIATDEKGYPPHIGAVKAQIRRLTAPHEMTEAEAWGIIAKAIYNSAYNSQKEFNKLPENLQRLVGSPSQLKEWSLVDRDKLQTVIASNFQRSYRARAAADREYAALPSDVKALVSGVGANFALESKSVDKKALGATIPQPCKPGEADKRAREDMESLRKYMDDEK